MMIDKVVVRLSILIVVGFILTAIFYQRPVEQKQRAPYLPPEGFIANADNGRKTFNKYCIRCHGQKLEGTDKGPSLLHPYYKPEHHGDLSIYLAVFQGVKQHHWQFGDMPAFKQLNPEDAGHLLLYIRQQQRQAGLIK